MPKLDVTIYEKRLRDMVADGLTCTAAAKALGIHYKAAKRMAEDELGIEFVSGGRGGWRGRPDSLYRWEQRIKRRSRRELALDPVARWA